jgi:hypothetical protein
MDAESHRPARSPRTASSRRTPAQDKEGQIGSGDDPSTSSARRSGIKLLACERDAAD